jgi:hypothetical protein
MIADSRHFGEEQDPDPDPNLSEKSDPVPRLSEKTGPDTH